MSNVDERVVQMRFDNATFQAGVQQTLDQLAELNKALKLQGATKGLSDLGAASKGVDLGHLADGVDAIKNKFGTLSVAGITAISNIANKAVNAGITLVKSFTIDPIKAGFQNYETQINAVQTILANTGLKGAAGLKQVNAVLADLNKYANQTVYNFSEMARNIGTFTAAGVKLDVAKDAIKGIANLAALSGSNSDQASTAMYQLSQAIAANKVGLQDWNSVVNAGLGGKVFQQALFNTGQALHTIKSANVGQTFEEWTNAGHSFRNSLQDGWITGKVLTQTLQGFTGDLTAAQLKSQGYNDTQIKQIQEMGRTAVAAATNIKTLSQLKDALKEEVATAFSAVFKTLFGDITSATEMFSKLHVALENGLTNPIYAFNRVLEGWSQLGGRTKLIDALKTGFHDLSQIIKPIKEAFNEIFPATTAKTLYNLTVGLDNLVHSFKMGAGTAGELKRTFAGLFAAVDIVWQILKQTAEFVGSLLSPLFGKGSGAVLHMTAGLGDFLVHLDQVVKKGVGLNQFFQAIQKAIQPVIAFLGMAVVAVKSFIESFHINAPDILGWIQNIPQMLQPAYAAMKNFFHNLFGNINAGDIASVLTTGLIAALALSLKRLVDHFRGGLGNPLGGIISSITAPFHSLNETLETMQKTLKAATILEIALAVAALTISVIELSKINEKDLEKSLGAITVMFAQLMGSLALFNRIGAAKGLIATGTGLVLLAVAVDVLVVAVKSLSSMSWEELGKGLAGITGLLLGLTLAVRGMSVQNASMIRTGAGLILLAAAIKILVTSVQDFSAMSWGEIAKGLTGVAALLAALTLFTRFAEAGKAGLLQGAGIVLLATGIKILASAAEDFGKMNWGEIAKGLTSIVVMLGAVALFSKVAANPATLLAAGVGLNGIAASMLIFAKAMSAFGQISWEGIAKGLVSMGVSLGIIALAMNAMPGNIIGTSLGLIAIGEALKLIAAAMAALGGLSWGEIAKGLVTLAGALVIIAAAVILMQESLAGAAALLVVSGALSILADVITKIGNLSWAQVAEGLATLAAAFVILGAAGLVLTPLAPTILALGVAIALLGVGVVAIGAGVLLLATGLTALAASGAAAASAITLILTAVIAMAPKLAAAVGAILIALSNSVIQATPKLLQAAVVFISGLLQAIVTLTPRILSTLVALINDLLNALIKNVPGFIDKGAKLILAVLDGITRNAPRVISAFVNMIVTVLNALAGKIPSFVTAAVNLIVAFLNGIASNVGRVITAGVNIVIALLQGIASNTLRIINAAGKIIVDFLNGIASAIKTYEPQMIEAGANIAAALVEGAVSAFGNLVKRLVDAALGLFGKAINAVKGLLGISSPSKVFYEIGVFVTQGFVNGITHGSVAVASTMKEMNGKLLGEINSFKAQITSYSAQLANLQKNGGSPLAIALTQLALAKLNAELREATKAYWDLNVTDKAQVAHLTALGKAYDALTPKIADATQKLVDAKKVRDDFAAQTVQQVDQLPDITGDTQLNDYVKTLQYQVNDLSKFTDVLGQLRKMGLNDALYKQLLAKGPAVLGFAEQLLAGGSDAVKNLDSLSNQLDSASQTLGKDAGSALYQAGVDAAQGLVDGLKAQQAAISAQMKVIADAMVAQIKHDLGIKSPSTIMAELGEFINQGLANGLKSSIPTVIDATSQVGAKTLDAMKEALSGASDIIDASINRNPVIAPVVDLSGVTKSAAELDSLLGNKQMNLGVSLQTAKDASNGVLDNKAAAAAAAGQAAPVAPGAVSLTYIQNNSSPKALSSAEIYRQTNNQLSRIKGGLATNATQGIPSN